MMPLRRCHYADAVSAYFIAPRLAAAISFHFAYFSFMPDTPLRWPFSPADAFVFARYFIIIFHIFATLFRHFLS